MTKALPLLLLFICTTVFSQKTDIVILGTDHFSQIYKEDNPNTDIKSDKRKTEINSVIDLIGKYKPDCIMVEELPENQPEIDSMYNLYIKGTLNTSSRREIFNIAFPIAKKHNLKKVYCVNAPGATSQSLLDNGDNIELYKNETLELREIVMAKYKAINNGTLSFKDYLAFLNQPDTYNKVYHLKYITPARVINGTFKGPDEMIDSAFVNTKYIGAELTSVWKNRDYKIYSNIVTTQLKEKPKRILLLIGVGHVGSLKSIFRDDPEYNFIEANTFLK
ncbi:DUF5694 domain-containing protein [Flavobacterium rakeshii]|uniref:DUF5694 domain-containing protein n=1 Tax=Flavobacterium rakeshii TaxID=1038845 RepID=UPI002E7B9F17|nr:DUF5694 domain-containing protein [Flavobacterium rakeshii]MEE1899991.1 DUF5694 domain-containing protein [Flavobacterium rakeshii]